MTSRQRLGLGAEYTDWLESLERLGPPSDEIRIPSGSDAARLLRLLGFDESDVQGVLQARAELDESPEVWWLLERAIHGVRERVGDMQSVATMPSLPVELGAVGRCFWIFVYMATVPDIRAWHHARGIADEISWDTLADLGRHVRLYRGRSGSTGLDTPWWIALHFQGSIYALGRLQFQMYRLKTGPGGPLFWYEDSKEDGFRRGDRAIGLHIPESGSLTPEACDDSFKRARLFFERQFPEYADAVVTCTSWLLDEQLTEYLKPESNIIQFQRRFELVPGAMDSDTSAFHFVFGHKPEQIDQLTPRTTLERAMVQHVKNGKHWRLRTGWLKLRD